MTATIWPCRARAADPDRASVVEGVEVAAGRTAGTLAAVVELAAAPTAEAVGPAEPQPATIVAAIARDATENSVRRMDRRGVEIIGTSCGPSSSNRAASSWKAWLTRRLN
jgi:hypothetical protein